jgi:hypothetical protein
MARAPAFQAGDAGSIPVTRSPAQSVFAQISAHVARATTCHRQRNGHHQRDGGPPSTLTGRSAVVASRISITRTDCPIGSVTRSADRRFCTRMVPRRSDGTRRRLRGSWQPFYMLVPFASEAYARRVVGARAWRRCWPLPLVHRGTATRCGRVTTAVLSAADLLRPFEFAHPVDLRSGPCPLLRTARTDLFRACLEGRGQWQHSS